MTNHPMIQTFILVATLVAMTAISPTAIAAEPAELPPVADKQGVTFENDIKPLFGRSCTECHGEEKQKSKLRLDTLDHVLKGAKGEPVIVPGKSAESPLVLSVAHVLEDEEMWMPPPEKTQPFSKEEVSLLRAWVDQGAK